MLQVLENPQTHTKKYTMRRFKGTLGDLNAKES